MMNLSSSRPALARRANPSATFSVVLGLLGTAAAIAIWATQLHRTGLVGDVYFPTYAAVLANFWSVAAWWAVTLLCPVLAAISGHTGLRRKEVRQDGVTRGRPAAVTGVILAYLVILLSSGVLLASLLIHFITIMTG